jgi:beta-lactamase regulating signal transducer with metallopeptidase domain
MHVLTAYLIKSSVISGIFYTYYLLALRNKKFHTYNRFYLLAAVAISLLAPLISIKIYQVQPAAPTPLISLMHVINGSSLDKTNNVPVTAELIVAIIFSLVSFSLLTVMLYKIAWIYRIKRAGIKTRKGHFNLIETNARQAPFSFLNNLFWRAGMPVDDVNGKKIFMHELAHIKQRHTYDKLFTQTVTCLFWINPFYWIIQNELNNLHEFVADAAAIDEGDAASFATMLLQAHNGGRYLSLSNSFFHPSIKRRLFMITNSGKTSYAYTRRIMALLVAILVFVLFSVSLQAQQKSKPVDHIEIHGQTGIGDTAIIYFKNGTKERLLLNNPADNKIFKQKYEALLAHPAGPLSKEPKEVESPQEPHEPVAYQPLDPIPANISNITFGSSTIWLTLISGEKEQYDLTNAEEKKNFESKYGKLKTK